jgi:hypothetical protein
MIDNIDISGSFSDELYASNPKGFKRALAMRLLWLLLPTYLSDNLPKWMSRPVVLYWIVISPEDSFVDGVTLPPGFVLPEYVVPDDKFISGATLPPGAIKNIFLKPQRFPEGQGPRDKRTVIVNPADFLDLGKPGTKLPPGTQIRPILNIIGPGGPLPVDALPISPVEVTFGGIAGKVPPANDIPIFMKPSDGASSADIPTEHQQIFKYIKDQYFQKIIDKLIVDWYIDPLKRDQSGKLKSGTLDAGADESYSYFSTGVGSWLSERNAAEAGTVYPSDYYCIAGEAFQPSDTTWHLYRAIFEFTIPMIPAGVKIKEGLLVMYVMDLQVGSLIAQRSTATDLSQLNCYSSMTGPATAPSETEDDILTITLNSSIIDYINAHSGEDLRLMTREYTHDYQNNEPSPINYGTTTVQGSLAADPVEGPTLVLMY